MTLVMLTAKPMVHSLTELIHTAGAAAAAFARAAAAAPDARRAAAFGGIRDDHAEAVECLRGYLDECGGRRLLGDAHGPEGILPRGTGLGDLREVEERCRQGYAAALEGAALPALCRSFLRLTLLPRTHRHLEALRHLAAGAA